jgi:hypothetical protein
LRTASKRTFGSTQPRRRARRAVLWLLLAGLFGPGPLFGPGAAAAQQSPPAAASFWIEEIVVEGAVAFSPDILVAASLLKPGRSYSEAELRDAAFRVARLPLVIEAEVSLRRGSEPGRYQLVIQVEEARRWFFGLDSDTTFWSREVSVRGLRTTRVVDSGSAIIGRRFSVGRHGVLFAALSGSDGLLSVGYSRHELFGRGGLLSLRLAASDCSELSGRTGKEDLGDQGCQTEIFDAGLDPTISSWTSGGTSTRARLNLGIPMRGNHSLRLQASARSAESGIRRQAFGPSARRFFAFERLRVREFNLSWVYNSANDPLFPTSGLIAEAGIEGFALEADLENVDVADATRSFEARMDSEVLGVALMGRRHWPLGQRHSVSLGGRLFLGRSDVRDVPTADFNRLSGDATVWNGRVSAGHSRLLYLRRAPRSWRELRWTNEVELSAAGTSPEFGQADNPFSGLRLGTGLTLRTTWGVFSFRVSYFRPEGR